MTDIFTLGLKADTTDIDKGAKSLDKLADSAEGADNKAKQFRKGINTAGKAVATFGVTAAAALGVVTVAAGNAAREITNLSRLSNQTVEDFQRTAFAARAFGIEQDKLGDILKDVQDKVGDFLTTGAGPMVDFFEKIAPQVGITADNFRDLNGKDALQLYVSSLEKANVSQSEMIFFMEAIASDATLLQPLLANNGAEFERLAKRADELGIVLDQLDISNLNAMKTSLGELSAIAEGASNVIGAVLAPFVKDLTDRFNDNAISADTLREGMTTLIEVGVTVAGVYADAGRVFEIFGKALGATAFTLVESFNTMDARLEQLGVSFEMTFDELQLALIEWVNEQDAELARWATSMLNAADVFDVFDDVAIEPQPLDTSELEASISMLKAQAAGLETDLVQSNENIANAWQDVIDTMLQPLPSEGMDQWVQGIITAVEAQRELQDAITKTGKANNMIVQVSGSDAVKWISNIKEVTKGLGEAFGENEKIAKRLHQVNLVIGIAEQAMILQKVFADSAATQVHIANSTAKAGANAVEAVTAAAAAPFPVGFAAAAAMIGLMSSVLGSFGGGGGGFGGPSASEVAQEAQGTGTVLGSEDKTESIINAQERFTDIAVDQLAELRGIRGALTGVTAGISNLAARVAGGNLASAGQAVGVGDIVGDAKVREILGSSIKFATQNLGDIISSESLGIDIAFDAIVGRWGTEIRGEAERLDRVFQISRESVSVSATEEIKASVGQILIGLGETVSQSVALLGLEGKKTIEDFVVSIGNINLEGLTGEEIQTQLEAIFGRQADLMAQFLIPELSNFQRVGEGLFDTLARITQEQVVFNDAIDFMGDSLSSLSSIMQIEVAQSVIAIAGGFENFADITSSFVDNFFTDAEKLAMLEGSVTEAFNSLGQAAVTSREEFRKLVGGVDLTTVAGQELFAALLELNPALSEFIDGIEDAARDAFSMLEKAVSLERQRARAVLDVAGEAHKAEIGRIRELRSTLTSLDPSGFSSASELAVQTALNQNRLAQLDMLEESADAVFDLHKQGYADELSRLDQLIEDNESLLNAALGIDDSVLSVESAIAALNETIAALAPTSGGALPQTAGRATGDALREQTKDEVKKMREENAMFQREIVKNTKTTARLLQRMELNGIDTNAV